MHNFLYSLTICLLHYYPRHVSSINMSIFRRTNCIHTASGIFALCKRLHSTLVESGLQSALNQCTAVFCSESIECFPGTASKFFLKLLVTIPVAPIIIGIIVHFRFHIRSISNINSYIIIIIIIIIIITVSAAAAAAEDLTCCTQIYCL